MAGVGLKKTRAFLIFPETMMALTWVAFDDHCPCCDTVCDPCCQTCRQAMAPPAQVYLIVQVYLIADVQSIVRVMSPPLIKLENSP